MFENGKRPHITVVGDLILDRYLIGDASKMNPEQPGVVIRVDKEEDRLGGAAAVAMIAAGLGAKVTLAGVIGRDEPGQRLLRLIDSHNIEPHLWVDDRPTTWKQRIVARGQLRPDRCDREFAGAIGSPAARFLSTVPLRDMLLIADYAKGVCTTRLLESIGNRTRNAGRPILVDPAGRRRWSEYGQVTLIKANWSEAVEMAGGHDRPLTLVRRLADDNQCVVVATMGRHGMACADRGGGAWYLPATHTHAIDVCGAGDTVLATLGVALAQEMELRDACRLCVTAAAVQVSQLGIRPITTGALVRTKTTTRS